MISEKSNKACDYSAHLRERMNARQKSFLVLSDSASIFTRHPLKDQNALLWAAYP